MVSQERKRTKKKPKQFHEIPSRPTEIMHINKITSERENDMFGSGWKPKQQPKKKHLRRPIFIGAFRCRWSHTHRNRRRCCRRSRPHDRPPASAATSENMASTEFKRKKYEKKRRKKKTQRDIFLIRSLRFRFIALRLVGVLVTSTTAPATPTTEAPR